MSPARIVAIRGVELSVRDDGAGVPVVWGHGLTSSTAHEDEIGLLDLGLPADRYRMIRYDARGHGLSTGTRNPDDYRYEALSADQLGLLDELSIDRAVLGGASMGSVTALHTAVTAPDRVQALVLTIPPTAWETRRDRGDVYAAGAAVIERDGIETFIELAAADPPPAIFADFAGDLMEAMAQRYRELDPEVLPAVFRGVGASDLPPRDALRDLDIPTLVLAWDGDPVHPRSTAEELGRLLPQVDVHVADDLAGVLGWPDLARRFLDRVVRS
jgi:3-oxoadipate enol-lactonase